MSQVRDEQDPIAHFKAAAERYVALIETAVPRAARQRPRATMHSPLSDSDLNERYDFCIELAAALSGLYEAAMALPGVHDIERPNEDADEMPTEQWSTIAGPLGRLLADWEEYRSVIPAGPDAGEPWSTGLVDDLLDVYRDVGEGLGALSAGWPLNDVVWQWREGLRSHWGEHLVSALRVIHWHLAD